MRLAHELICSLDQSENCHLSKNEAILLHAVFLSGLITFREIRMDFLPNVAISSAHRTVRRLVNRGLVEPIIIRNKVAYGWRLTPCVQEQFTKMIGFRGLGKYRIQLFIEQHNEKVRRFARSFDQMVDAEWIAHEPTVRAHQMTVAPSRGRFMETSVPDLLAMMGSIDGPEKIAFEIELTLKSTPRLDQILENRISSDQWNRVIYLLGKELPKAKFIERTLRTLKTSSKVLTNKRANPILFVGLNDVESNGLQAKGSTTTGDTTLREFLKIPGI